MNRLKRCIDKSKWYFLRLYGGEKAQTMTEYGLLFILIAIALTVLLIVFSGSIANLFQLAGPELQNAPQY